MATLTAKIIADFTTQLATAIAVSGTTATLQSATDDDGVALPAGRYFFTLDGANSSKEHISCDLSGTSLTNIKTVSRQGTETAGVLRAHRIGASVSITDFAHILQINNLINGTTDLNASDPLKYDGTATINNANHLATKDYVDGVAIAGAPDSSTTVKGITKMSVAPASATSPIAVGDNDPRVPTQDENDALVGTSGTPSTSNKFVTNDDTATAATASKVVRRLASGDVTVPSTPTNTTDATSKTYVDTNIGTKSAMQILGSGSGDVMSVGFSQDGTQMFHTYFNANNQFTLVRWAKDTTTGQYYQVGDSIATIVGSAIFTSGTTVQGIAVIGSYVYVSMASYVYRFSNTNVAGGGTNLTISGTAPSGNPCAMYTNGTDLYINSGSGTTWYRYTISGTTITNAQTLTGPSGYTGAWSDGTKAYLYNGTTLGRYALTLSSVEASTACTLQGFGSGAGYTRGVGYSSSTGVFLVTIATNTGCAIILSSITRP